MSDKVVQVLFTIGVVICLMISGCAGTHVQTLNSAGQSTESCWMRLADNDDTARTLEETIDDQIERFQIYAEQLLVSAEESVALIEQVSSEHVSDKPIPPGAIEAIQVRMRQDLDLVGPVSHILAENTCWLEATPAELEARGLPELNKITRFKGIMLEIGASIVLYDVYLKVIATLNEVERLRRAANQGDSGFGLEEGTIEEVTSRYSSIANLTAIRSLVQGYDARHEEIKSYRQLDDNIAYLDILIGSSLTFRTFQDSGTEQLYSHLRSARSHTVEDSLYRINRAVSENASATFGNLVGRVEERKGKLYGRKDIEAYLATNLQAGDILLEKTPFRLTDRLIPGFWGHAAIWVGTPETLQQLGLWDTQLVEPFHERLNNDHLVAEALREGTTLNSLAHFLNIDDLAVLRPKHISETERRQVLTRTFRQLGKPYDFNFDVETTDKIVCSQLIYLAYPEIDWPTKAIAGRHTISPDNIAAEALDSSSFEIITLIRDGSFVLSNKSRTMASLLQQDRAGVQ